MARAPRRLPWFAVLMLSIGSGCSSRQGEATQASPPAPTERSAAPMPGKAEPAPESEAQLDDDFDPRVEIDTLLNELEEQEGSLQALGVVVDAELTTATPAFDGTDADRCERICKLATSICGLRDRICDLAEDHADDARYEKACTRAKRDCDRASSACSECESP